MRIGGAHFRSIFNAFEMAVDVSGFYRLGRSEINGIEGLKIFVFGFAEIRADERRSDDSLIRQVLTVAGTALVAKGFVQASNVEPVIGALLTIGSIIWSVADKRRK